MKVTFAEKFFDDLNCLFGNKLRHRVPRVIRGSWYWLKCRLWKKYNVVRVKTLPYTWNDRCELLPHAMFQILDDFVKKECSPEIINWDADADHKAARAKMDELLDWWKNIYLKFDEHDVPERPAGLDNLDEQVIKNENGLYTMRPCTEEEKEYYKKVSEREKNMNNELLSKMKELCELRPWLWT